MSFASKLEILDYYKVDQSPKDNANYKVVIRIKDRYFESIFEEKDFPSKYCSIHDFGDVLKKQKLDNMTELELDFYQIERKKVVCIKIDAKYQRMPDTNIYTESFQVEVERNFELEQIHEADYYMDHVDYEAMNSPKEKYDSNYVTEKSESESESEKSSYSFSEKSSEKEKKVENMQSVGSNGEVCNFSPGQKTAKLECQSSSTAVKKLPLAKKVFGNKSDNGSSIGPKIVGKYSNQIRKTDGNYRYYNSQNYASNRKVFHFTTNKYQAWNKSSGYYPKKYDNFGGPIEQPKYNYADKRYEANRYESKFPVDSKYRYYDANFKETHYRSGDTKYNGDTREYNERDREYNERGGEYNGDTREYNERGGEYNGDTREYNGDAREYNERGGEYNGDAREYNERGGEYNGDTREYNERGGEYRENYVKEDYKENATRAYQPTLGYRPNLLRVKRQFLDASGHDNAQSKMPFSKFQGKYDGKASQSDFNGHYKKPRNFEQTTEKETDRKEYDILESRFNQKLQDIQNSYEDKLKSLKKDLISEILDESRATIEKSVSTFEQKVNSKISSQLLDISNQNSQALVSYFEKVQKQMNTFIFDLILGFSNEETGPVEVYFYYNNKRELQERFKIKFCQYHYKSQDFFKYLMEHPRFEKYRYKMRNNEIHFNEFKTIPFDCNELSTPVSVYGKLQFEKIRDYLPTLFTPRVKILLKQNAEEYNDFMMLITIYEINIEFELIGKILLPPNSCTTKFRMMMDTVYPEYKNTFDLIGTFHSNPKMSDQQKVFWNPHIGYYQCRLVDDFYKSNR
jgi:hypothetical protein